MKRYGTYSSNAIFSVGRFVFCPCDEYKQAESQVVCCAAFVEGRNVLVFVLSNRFLRFKICINIK
jgi:hypothetical protein